ncbi:uncharacterized protein [Eurosta solidaginis]|uniref:uncharacterized protein n=1 Tax=Eurosta solidaginis TaxID=178769 RepID=UPI003531745A
MKNFYKHMKYKYGEEICTMLNHHSKQKQKLTQQTSQLNFLLECRKYDILPDHLTNSTKKITIKTNSNNINGLLEKEKRLFLKKLMNIEITQTNIDIKTTKDQVLHAEQRLKRILSEFDYNSVIQNQTLLNQRVAIERQTTQSTKLERLTQTHLKKLGIRVNNDWFVNKTEIHFPEEVKWLLSLGKKFTLPTTNSSFKPLKTIAEMEQVIQQIEDEREREIERTKLSSRIMQFKRHTKHNPTDKFILEAYRKTTEFLKKHKDIIVTDSDKGNKTVAMYRTYYNEKMNRLLEDKNTYKKARTDPTNALQKQNNNLVDELYKKQNNRFQRKKATNLHRGHST